jgi:hypothetical protein
MKAKTWNVDILYRLSSIESRQQHPQSLGVA